MKEVLGLILGGGQGARLYPLTRERSKPAVPLAGKYRLIDIPMSNCLNSGIEKIAILTQFNSASLHRHISRAYTRDPFSTGWVQILAAEQTPRSGDWYQGTADAVRKQMLEINEAGSRYVLILAGDHLYRMDYRDFAQYHVDHEAEVTIAVKPVAREDASSLGILKMDSEGRIVEFREKPKGADLDGMESGDDPKRPYMASMGIYFFNQGMLQEALKMKGDDFGKEIIPGLIGSHRVLGYTFDGYWEDIGTIRRFYEVNLDMAAPLPHFNLYSADHPIYTRPRFLPGSKVQGGHLMNVLLADGCRIQEATIRSSVIGLRSIISEGVTIQRSIIMGADFYETEPDRQENRRLGRPDIGIGASSVIEEAIVDKNARIGRRVIIRSIPNRPDAEGDNWVSRDGIVIIPKGAIIADGTVI
ncbi:MAG: glucose-1-phosphate adenylyltransferase [Anaerolineae bacterium]|nr:glucose-1-phosphate adenylyltransferase [Anaerolineae bacterium]